MKRTKKILKISLIAIASLVVLLIASTYLFRDKIMALVKQEINKTLVAEVDFKKVNISFFRHFPRVSIGLDNLQIVGTGTFQNDTLLSATRLDATVDIMSFIRGSNMNVHSVFVNSPRIHALVTKEGLANWDIVREDTSAIETESKPFHLQLKKYEIRNAYVVYDDRESDMRAEIVNLNHSGNGDFTSDLFTLATTTTADSLTYYYGAVPFLYKARTAIDADLKIDNLQNKYNFENLNILLNALKITGEGFISILDDGYDIDISFDAPATDFKHLLSLVPAVYRQDFDKVQTSGNASFQGRVKGVYNETSMPGYHVAMKVQDGSFRYPDLPKGIDQIRLNAVVDNPDGITDNTVVNISDASFRMDKDPFSFRLLLKHPSTAMFIDAAAKGNLDLNQVGQFVKLEKGTHIAGLLNADVSVKGNVSDLEKQQYQNFDASGTVDMKGFNYTSADYPEGVMINALHSTFTPAKVNVSTLNGEYLKTAFDATAQIDNLLNYLLSDKPLKASMTLNAGKIDLNKWMGVSEDTSSTASEPFIVPGNIDLVLRASAKEVDYEKLAIKNLSGVVTIADQTVKLSGVTGDALDGSIAISGSYSTRQDKKNPAIAFQYHIDKVDIQKTFAAFNTAQKLMPIGKFLAGKLTSSLSVNGNLDDGMNVEMNTLSGAGNLLLIEGVLSKFTPLEKIASTLHVSQLEHISMKDVKAFFEFSNGKLLMKPFTVKLDDIEMEIGGLQGFDESIDYAVNLKLPRRLLGMQGNQLVNNLATRVSSTGIPVNLGETVNLKLQIGGTIKNPTIRTDLKQTGETLATQMTDQVKEFAQAKIDSAKSAAADTLGSIKKQLADAAREELRKQLLGGADSASASEGGAPQKAAEKAKESAKGLLKGILNREKPKSKVDSVE